jgi:hypothetical protein
LQIAVSLSWSASGTLTEIIRRPSVELGIGPTKTGESLHQVVLEGDCISSAPSRPAAGASTPNPEGDGVSRDGPATS